MTTPETPIRCLQCEQTREEIRRDQTICGIESGYEYRELAEEWPRHRWRDWSDRELAANGIKPEAYKDHRRTPAMSLQWIGCDDTIRGHALATKESDYEDFGARVGQCILCGHKPKEPR